jgi:DNA-binding MarR family transcriptional regulator
MNQIATPAVEKLRLALQPFFKELKQTVPARSIEAVLLVAQYEGESMSDYARRAKMSTSSMSRNLLDLGPRDRYMRKGYGLLIRRENPNNPSHAQYFLSEKGKALLKKSVSYL